MIWICLTWTVHDPQMMIQASISSLLVMWLPEITSSAFCKRFKPRRERSWSELRQSTEEFVWELDSNSSARNPAEAFSQQSQSYCEYKPNWQICSTAGGGGGGGGGEFSHVYSPMFSHVLVYSQKNKLVEEVFWPLRVPKACLCEGSGCCLVRSCPPNCV